MRPPRLIKYLLAHPPFAILLALAAISMLSRLYLLLS